MHTYTRTFLRYASLALLLSCLPIAQAQQVDAASAPTAETASDNPPPPPSGQVYRSVDANGKVTFTNAPPKGGPSEPVKLAPANTIPPFQPAATVQTEDPAAVVHSYSHFAIVSPAEGEVFGFEVEDITLSAEIEPGMQMGDRVQFFLDGNKLGEPVRALVKHLPTLERGTHIATASVLDQNQDVLISTEPVTFEIRRYSKLNDPKQKDDKAPDTSAGFAPVGGSAGTRGISGSTPNNNIGGAGGFSGSTSVGQPVKGKPASK